LTSRRTVVPSEYVWLTCLLCDWSIGQELTICIGKDSFKYLSIEDAAVYNAFDALQQLALYRLSFYDDAVSTFDLCVCVRLSVISVGCLS